MHVIADTRGPRGHVVPPALSLASDGLTITSSEAI